MPTPSQLNEIPSTAVISSTKELLSSELSGEAVILDMASGIYYGLNEVGARVWELVQQPRSLESVHTILVAEYSVDPEVCRRDLVTILIELQKAHLVVVGDEKNQ